MRTAFSLIPFCRAPVMTATSQLQPCKASTHVCKVHHLSAVVAALSLFLGSL